MKNIYVVFLGVFFMKCSSPESTTSQIEMKDIKTIEQRMAYAKGFNLSNTLRKQGKPIDLNVLFQGMSDATSESKEPLFTENERVQIIKAFRAKNAGPLKKERDALAKANLEKSRSFLSENAKKEGVTVLSSGLQYKVTKNGTDAKPNINNAVNCIYEIRTTEGKLVESSAEPVPQPFYIKDILMPGWKEGLLAMPLGSHWTLYLPPALAMGVEGKISAGVAPNSVLIIDIRFFEIMEEPSTKENGTKKTS